MSKILSKLAKLVSHADSAAALGNHAEEKAFRATINGLCKRHKIKLEDVISWANKNGPISSEIVVTGPRTLEKWEVMIFSAVTTLKNCRGLILDNGGLSVAGRHMPRRESIRLHRELFQAADQLSSEFANKHALRNNLHMGGFVSVSAFENVTPEERKTSFAVGFAEQITQTVVQAIETRKRKVKLPARIPKGKRVPLRPTDLAVVERPAKDELEEVDEYVAMRTAGPAIHLPGDDPEPTNQEPDDGPIDVHGESFDAGMMAARAVAGFFSLQ